MNLSGRNWMWRVAAPIVIGVVVAVWLVSKDWSADAWHKIDFSARTVAGLLLAVFFMIGKDFGLTWRFRTISDKTIGWGRALRVDMMCAFTSAITPSVVGGSALAIFYLNREGMNVGRATSLTLTTLLLDEMFFVIFCPIIFISLPEESLFGTGMGVDNAFLGGVKVVFWLVYAGIVIWTAILYGGIIAWPQAVARILMYIFSLPVLRRWQSNIKQTTDNMLTTSAWVKHQSWRWWMNVFGATVVSWFSRYLIVNALFWSFVPDVSPILVFARQFVVWVVLMISPTPGGSGLSEWLFTQYYSDLMTVPAIAVVVALIWRVISYYIYLVVGSALVPTYFGNKKNKPTKKK